MHPCLRVQARAFLNLVRFEGTLAVHRLRSRKFSTGASAGKHRASERWACQGSAGHGFVLKRPGVKAVYWGAVSIPCRSATNPALHIADSPMALGRSGVTISVPACGVRMRTLLLLRHRRLHLVRSPRKVAWSAKSRARRAALGAKTTSNSMWLLGLLLSW
jgi:hypothetical protein